MGYLKLKLSIKTILAGMMLAILASVLILGGTALMTGTRVGGAGDKLSKAAFIESLNTELVVLLNTMSSRQLTILSAKFTEELQSITSHDEIANRLNNSLTALKDAADTEELNAAVDQLIPLVTSFINADQALEGQTHTLLALNEKTIDLTRIVQENTAKVVSNTASMVSGIATEVEAQHSELKTAMNDTAAFSDPQKLAGVREILQRLLLSNKAEQQKAGYEIRTNVTRLAGIANTISQLNDVNELKKLIETDAKTTRADIKKSLDFLTQSALFSPALRKSLTPMVDAYKQLNEVTFEGDNSVRALRISYLQALTERQTLLEKAAGLSVQITKELSLVKEIILGAISDAENQTGSIISQSTVTVLVVGCAIAAIVLALGFLVVQRVIRPLDAVVSAMADVAEGEGDLTKRIDSTGVSELAALSNRFNTFVQKMQSIVQQIQQTVHSMSDAVEHSTKSAAQTDQSTATQQDQIKQLAGTVTNIVGAIDGVSTNAGNAAKAAEKADKDAKYGNEVVESTVSAIELLASKVGSAAGVMEELAVDTNEVGQVLDVIQGIAEQTNLLALNAAIEAARAGDQGRGFAVVADEVRTLASRTQNSTEEIRKIIERLQQGSSKTSAAMSEGNDQAQASVQQAKEAMTSLTEITDAVNTILEMNQQIANSAEKQLNSVNEINHNVSGINNVAMETSNRSRQAVEFNQQLSSLATTINSLVSQFKV
ncbi:MAG: methyl-accepting chemotaxis protein [Pseudomonadota bacterium]